MSLGVVSQSVQHSHACDLELTRRVASEATQRMAAPRCPRYATPSQLRTYTPTYIKILKAPVLRRHFERVKDPGYLMLKRTTRLVIALVTIAYFILKSITIAPMF